MRQPRPARTAKKSTSKPLSCDLAIVGGGLAGGLIALALARTRPDLDLRIVEASDRLGGNHVWSYFADDVAASDRWIVAPLICHGWTGHDVAFPTHHRTLPSSYYSIESDRLDQLVRQTLPKKALMLGRKVIGASATEVVLDTGERMAAKGVIDARGTGNLSLLDLGWQKFVGRELEMVDTHGVERPVIMDATVEQIDGYRFVYTLPFTPTRLFVEDTYYSDTAAIDTPAITARIDDYVAAHDWRAQRVLRQEQGALPVALGGDFEGYWRSGGHKVAKAGMRAGLFHPTTGYSLPDAVRTAALIARSGDLSGEALHELTYGHARDAWRRRGFYRMLDKMLFRAGEAAERYRILQRFYRLNPALIGRFYAGQTTMMDSARILAGKPPVPVLSAIRAIRGQAA